MREILCALIAIVFIVLGVALFPLAVAGFIALHVGAVASLAIGVEAAGVCGLVGFFFTGGWALLAGDA